MSRIAPSGFGSGIDFDALIKASVQSKAVQIGKNSFINKEISNTQLSGVGALRSALEEFKKSINALNDGKGFDLNKVTTNDSSDNPTFSISTKNDCANGSFDISVEQIASSENISQVFDKGSKFSAGTIKFTIPGVKNEQTGEVGEDRVIEIQVNEGDSLEQIRKKINDNEYGLTASIVSTAEGDKLVIDSGVTGQANDGKFSMSFTPANASSVKDGLVDSSKFFNYNSSALKDGQVLNGWTKKAAQDAIIYVDGEEARSSTNTFENTISGLTITVNRVSDKEKDENGNDVLRPVRVNVEQDIDAVAQRVNDFVNAYNKLQDSINSLYKPNSYTEGQNNYDGGHLAGDPMLKALKSSLDQVMTSMTSKDGDLYSLGINVDSNGKWSFDADKFKDNLDDNYKVVTNLFNGENGVLTQLDKVVDSYIKDSGVLDLREEQLSADIKDHEIKANQNAEYLSLYEQDLRKKYTKLNVVLSQYNQSMMFLQSALV